MDNLSTNNKHINRDFQAVKIYQTEVKTDFVILLCISGMLLDFLFPKHCIGCNSLGSVLCKACRKDIRPTLQDVCPYCFYKSPGGKTHDRCNKENSLDGAISVVRYNAIARKIVKGIKYHLAYDIYNQIVDTLPNHWWRADIYTKFSTSNTIIQPIPLHPLRKKMRGFNQADIIAAVLSKQTEITTTNVLQRVKNTKPQAMIPTKKQRIENIKNAFSVRNKLSILKKTVILVDDIFTSASTAKEAARVLKKNGAASVVLYTFAHGS